LSSSSSPVQLNSVAMRSSMGGAISNGRGRSESDSTCKEREKEGRGMGSRKGTR
jgi:hypothetical protein